MLPDTARSGPALRRIPILMYHSVSVSASRRFRRFAVAPERFEEQVRYMRDNGYVSLTVSRLVEGLHRSEMDLPDKCFAFTFDDGLEDFFTTALPILIEYGATATLYIVTGRVGGTASWLDSSGEGHRRMLSWSQIEEICRAGIEIGAHTVTHPALDAISLAAARREIYQSKYSLEDRLGVAVRSFAYPFGYYDRPVRRLVQEAGFDSACAVRYAFSSREDNRFTLSRQIVRHDASADDVGAIVAGNVPILPHLYDRARSNAWRLVRHSLRGLKP